MAVWVTFRYRLPCRSRARAGLAVLYFRAESCSRVPASTKYLAFPYHRFLAWILITFGMNPILARSQTSELAFFCRPSCKYREHTCPNNIVDCHTFSALDVFFTMSSVNKADSSEDIADFLLRIRELGEKRDQEDEERTRKLEADILQGRKERQARRGMNII